ncbi:MAG: ubiquinol-cytochrome c reductase iron-sulfur subunit [Planctomycetales bacterium]|nr:ubiquinol-cytochrome c reductase iron-sulfur subunit [Planctomycetales bacterium]
MARALLGMAKTTATFAFDEFLLGGSMADEQRPDTPNRQTPSAADAAHEVDRRSFLSEGSTVTMAGGLVAAYGTLGVYAGRFLYPSSGTTAWMFVAPADDIEPGGSLEFTTPGGLRIVITRSSASAANVEPPVEDFLALSSTCPHLGCRVHWESQNDRFFCPCHNGAFDPRGRAIAGPPKDAGQSLPLYALKVEQGLLYIEAPVQQMGDEALAAADIHSQDKHQV